MRRLALLLILLVVSCGPRVQRSRMWRHYDRVGAIQQAVLAGDLGAAQRDARWLARNPAQEELPELGAPYVDSMRLAARALADAADLTAAAMATARMGGACGACHQVLLRWPRATQLSLPPPPSDTSVPDQMTLHRWVLSRMWDGLTGPSPASWAAGATGLNATPRYQAHITHTGGNRAVNDSLARRVYALGQRAIISGGDDRVAIYGELIGTCASCHEQNRVRLPHGAAY